MVLVERELCGEIVKQDVENDFFSLSDIMNIICKDKINNKQSLHSFNFSNWLTSDNTKEFLAELEKEIGKPPYIKGAKNRSGWAHPFFVVKILTHFIPNFEVQVYKWLTDYIVANIIIVNNTFDIMLGTIYKYTSNKSKFHSDIKVLANMIKNKVACDDWNNATKEQLEKRDYLQTSIAELTQTLKEPRQAIKIAFQMYDNKYIQRLENDNA